MRPTTAKFAALRRIRSVRAAILALALTQLLFGVGIQAQRAVPQPSADEAYSRCMEIALHEKAEGDIKGAIVDFTKAIQLKPNSAEAYNYRGLAKYDKGDLKGAIADFTKAIGLKADYAQAYRNRANARYFKGDLNGSRKDDAQAAAIERELTSKRPPSFF